MDGHKYDVPAPKTVPEPVSPPETITAKDVTDKIVAVLPPTDAKQFNAVADRIARRQKQVREAVARHRAKAKKVKATSPSAQIT